MATLTELLAEIRQLLKTLSDKFGELSENIANLKQIESGDSADTAVFSPFEEEGIIDGMDDTQSLEPPPADETVGMTEEETKADESDEPKTSEMEAVSDEDAPPAKEEEAQKPPAQAGALPLLEKLSRLDEIVKKKKLEISSKDLAFIPKSTEVYASLSDKERVGAKGARIVLDCINFLDTLAYKYAGDYYSPLREAVGALTKSLSEFVQREAGYHVFPLEEKTRQEIEAVVPDYASAVQEKNACNSSPAGTIVAVRRRGAVLDGNVVRKAQILLSAGEQMEAGKVLEAALNAVSGLKAASDRSAEMKLKAMSSLIEWCEKLHGSSEDHALTVTRYALNLLHTLEHPIGVRDEMFPGQTKKIKRVNERILELLRSAGLNEIIVSVGGTFNETYDPSKYERKKVASEKPEGTIIGILRRGFLDRNGIPIQKAVIAVSGK
jgi:molecular chaperone GrpE (heat shock protein)